MLRIISRISLIIVFLTIFIGVIALARGYRLDLKNQTITSTGILAVSSNPAAAKIYVNGELKGVTNSNLTLPPGAYTVEVKKEGFTSWKKEISLKGEIVMTADAILFPKNPSLSPLTSRGIVKAVNLDQTGEVLVFINNDIEEEDGIYLFEPSRRTLSFAATALSPIVLRTTLPPETDFEQTNVYFAPDYRQAIIEFTYPDETTRSYLFAMNREHTEADLIETTNSKETFLETWERQKALSVQKVLETFPEELSDLASSAARIISFSPDETKVIYEATQSASLPPVLTPPLIGANQTPEERNIKPGQMYLYDKKEDKNFRLTFPFEPLIDNTTAGKKSGKAAISSGLESYNLQWYPDSKHIVFLKEETIVIAEYDGGNSASVYSGPLQDNYFLATENFTLLILANLNPQNNLLPDMYEVGIQ